MNQPSLTRRISGRKAKRHGTEFEQYLINIAYSQNVAVIRINDGCRQVSPTRLIRMKQPFDFVLVAAGESIFCDTKSTDNNTFTRSQIDEDQLRHLNKCQEHGCRSGYLVLFRETNRIIFFDAYQLSALNHGEGLQQDEGTDCGTTFTPQLQVLFKSFRELTEPLTLYAAP